MKAFLVLDFSACIKTINIIYIYIYNICKECVMTISVVSLFSYSHAIITTKIESQTVYTFLTLVQQHPIITMTVVVI